MLRWMEERLNEFEMTSDAPPNNARFFGPPEAAIMFAAR